MRPRETDRAVSTTLGYVLTLSITAVLVSGLLVGTGQYVDGQRKQVTAEELSVVGERVAARTADADRLARVGDAAEVRVRVDLPRTVGGRTYRVEVTEPESTTPHTHDITLLVTGSEQSRTVTVRTGTDIEEGSVAGGTVVVAYDPAADRLGFESETSVAPSVAPPPSSVVPSSVVPSSVVPSSVVPSSVVPSSVDLARAPGATLGGGV